MEAGTLVISQILFSFQFHNLLYTLPQEILYQTRSRFSRTNLVWTFEAIWCLKAYLLFKFEQMTIEMLLQPLICIIYAKLLKAIFLKAKCNYKQKYKNQAKKFDNFPMLF